MVEVYILKNDGTLLYYTALRSVKGASLENATLFSGVISAIKNFLKELKVGDIQTFATNENNIFIKSEVNCSFVLVLSKIMNTSEKDIFDFLSRLARKIQVIANSEDITFHIDDDLLTKIERETNMLLQEFEDKFKESKTTRNLLDTLW